MYQSSFNFINDTNYIREDYFVGDFNKDAFDLVSNRNLYWGVRPYDNVVLLLAPKKSGKTYLCNLWKDNFGAIFINNELDYFSLIGDASYPGFMVDELEIISESDLFHIFNLCHEHRKKLLITSSRDISLLNIRLPDLLSRLKSVKQIYIYPPEDKAVRLILAKYFSQRSIKISADIIDYMAARVPRNFASIFDLVQEVDKLSLLNKKNVTIPLIKQLLDML